MLTLTLIVYQVPHPLKSHGNTSRRHKNRQQDQLIIPRPRVWVDDIRTDSRTNSSYRVQGAELLPANESGWACRFICTMPQARLGLTLTGGMKIASFYRSTHCYLLQATATEEDGQFNRYQISLQQLQTWHDMSGNGARTVADEST